MKYVHNRYDHAMFTRELIEARERQTLAPYALFSGDSKGRKHEEATDPFRTAYRRDRDRVIHSTAFRRLEYKTQVFVYHEGDYYRTRLTHTIEVSQIARSVAIALGLNESFVEALSLAHDLGHPPFGHAGGQVLHSKMVNHGGFEHNVHGLRIVDLLERRYHDFAGLNLTYEIREAILKHSTTKHATFAAEFTGPPSPCLETQLVDLADSTAYHHHDMDDGLRSGILDLETMADASALVGECLAEARRRCDPADQRQIRLMTINGVVKRSILDLVQTSAERLESASPRSSEEARGQSGLIGLSDKMASCHEELHRYLVRNFYRHHRVTRMMDKAGRLLKDLFDTYTGRPELLPPEFQAWAEREGTHRAVCDYIAGMTDRYAEQDYRKLFDPTVRV
ncbi:MAG: deoxyguanosinetriphosphate triphosphohydrolase [Planctomycetota bacterium]